jgi:hypothetical protein
MYRWTAFLVFFVATLTLNNSAALCWETSYEADVLPNSPDLGAAQWSGGGDLSLTYVENGVLRMVDPWGGATQRGVYFYRESGLPAGTPATIESRVRVFSASSTWFWGHPGFGIQTWSSASTGGMAKLALFPDKVVTRYSGDTVDREYAVDLTQWHTFRTAMKSDNWFDVWMDGGLIFSGLAYDQGQDGFFFGIQGAFDLTGDIEWDYVRYSKQYLPIPEPSSLLALGGGLGGIALLRRRVRSKQ